MPLKIYPSRYSQNKYAKENPYTGEEDLDLDEDLRPEFLPNKKDPLQISFSKGDEEVRKLAEKFGVSIPEARRIIEDLEKAKIRGEGDEEDGDGDDMAPSVEELEGNEPSTPLAQRSKLGIQRIAKKTTYEDYYGDNPDPLPTDLEEFFTKHNIRTMEDLQNYMRERERRRERKREREERKINEGNTRYEEDDDDDNDDDDDDLLPTLARRSKLGIQRIAKKTTPVQKTAKAIKRKLVMAQSADEIAFGGDTIRIPNHAYLEAARKIGDINNLNRAKQIRSEFRKSLLRKAEELENIKMIKQAKQIKKINAVKEKKLVPKNEYTNNARTLIANRLIELGVPQTTATMYVKSVYNPKNKEIMENIMKIASLDAESKVKKSMIKAFVKESQNKLDPDNIQRIKDYWKNELGYQDTKWIDDLVKDIDPVTGG